MRHMSDDEYKNLFDENLVALMFKAQMLNIGIPEEFGKEEVIEFVEAMIKDQRSKTLHNNLPIDWLGALQQRNKNLLNAQKTS